MSKKISREKLQEIVRKHLTLLLEKAPAAKPTWLQRNVTKPKKAAPKKKKKRGHGGTSGDWGGGLGVASGAAPKPKPKKAAPKKAAPKKKKKRGYGGTSGDWGGGKTKTKVIKPSNEPVMPVLDDERKLDSSDYDELQSLRQFGGETGFAGDPIGGKKGGTIQSVTGGGGYDVDTYLKSNKKPANKKPADKKPADKKPAKTLTKAQKWRKGRSKQKGFGSARKAINAAFKAGKIDKKQWRTMRRSNYKNPGDTMAALKKATTPAAKAPAAKAPAAKPVDGKKLTPAQIKRTQDLTAKRSIALGGDNLTNVPKKYLAANPKTRSKEDKATLKNLGINPEAQGSAMAHKSLTKQPQAAKPPAKQPAAPKTPTQTPAAPTVDTTGDTDKLSDADWKLMGMGGGKKKIAKARALSDKDLAAKTPAAPVKPVTPAAPKKRDDKVYYESKNKLFTTNNKKGNSTMKISRKKSSNSLRRICLSIKTNLKDKNLLVFLAENSKRLSENIFWLRVFLTGSISIQRTQ